MNKKTLILPIILVTLTGCGAQNEDDIAQADTVEVPTITLAAIEEAQEAWAESIVAIGEASTQSEEAAEEQAKETLDTLYAFDEGTVLLNRRKLLKFLSAQQRKKPCLISLVVILKKTAGLL